MTDDPTPHPDTREGLAGSLDRTRATLESTNDRLDRLNKRTVWQWVVSAMIVLGVAATAYAIVGQRQVADDLATSARRTELQRCEDSIVARAQLRATIPGVVDAMFRPDATEGGRLDVYLERGRQYMAANYGPPRCASRLGLDVEAIEADHSDDIAPAPPA